MEGTEVRSASCGAKSEEIEVDSFRFREEIQRLMPIPPPETGSSFTALLELPANQAMQILDSPETDDAPPTLYGCRIEHPKPCMTIFPSCTALVDQTSKPSVFATAEKCWRIRAQNWIRSSAKRKEREKKVKGSNDKSKTVANEKIEDGEKLPYVHVRARRGQATDSHSLAERARREKINARIKQLQELIPGCKKLLSMRLAAVNPRIDLNLDSLLAAETPTQDLKRTVCHNQCGQTGGDQTWTTCAICHVCTFTTSKLFIRLQSVNMGGSAMDTDFPGMVMPLMWPEGQVNGNRQQYQLLQHCDGLHESAWGRGIDYSCFVTPENSILSFDSSANSVHPPKEGAAD
ncbi:unnamed protein product [Ilex paraguariensis]|uniref:BHLH domain-containing protein n=1 Tax=Ilex paraguariensis TaxID=185542 RepID=A0ABC8SMI4_9AQUA